MGEITNGKPDDTNVGVLEKINRRTLKGTEGGTPGRINGKNPGRIRSNPGKHHMINSGRKTGRNPFKTPGKIIEVVAGNPRKNLGRNYGEKTFKNV